MQTSLKGITKTMQTSLEGIANKAVTNKTHRFRNLSGLLNRENLLWCWQFVNKKAAVGVDKESAYEYEQNLETNVAN
jgi:hypothetical protein